VAAAQLGSVKLPGCPRWKKNTLAGLRNTAKMLQKKYAKKCNKNAAA